ncbi:metallophosphoesterase family protein [Haloquadratum walsbyi]|jgi:predicted phosphodiesterase|uniref:metallophosphoesterase family protein n=1 Tax=Haloquadratum walsbyi TaxID=293091 RepID=UPI0015F4F6F7|nr:metallophosphoesterase [Haloquadratum walsbyi]
MSTIGIITDIHLREAYHDEIIERLHKIKHEYMNTGQIAHTFILGDLLQESTKHADREHLDEIKSIFDEWVSPVTYLLGNHDVATHSKDELSEILDQDRFHGIVWIDNQAYVYLDSVREDVGARGIIGPDQRSWLDDTLPSDAIVLSHHPLGPFSIEDNVWFGNYPERAYPWDRQETLEILQKTAKASVSGHIHQPGRTAFRGVSHISVNAVSKETPKNPVSGNYARLNTGESLEIKTGHVE